MNYRVTQLLASESIATAATKTLDINVTDPLSRIAIRVKGTNSSSTPTAHPAKMITTIELVDGSYVLFSMSGQQCQALNFVENGELPFNICEYENDIECCACFEVNFGRWLFDADLALDPKRFNNLQLKITHNKASGGSAPDAGTMAVFAYVFDDKKISPRGFLMSKVQYSYTMVASAHEYVDLATDYPYRFLLLEAYKAGYAMNTQIGYIKFTLDNDAKVLINNLSMSEFLKVFPPQDKVEENFAGLGTGSAVTYYIASTYENYVVATGRSASQTTLIAGQPSGPQVSITNDSSESFGAYATGYAAFGAVNLITADKLIIDDWFNPRPYKSAQLDITAGSGCSGTASIISQQLRPY